MFFFPTIFLAFFSYFSHPPQLAAAPALVQVTAEQTWSGELETETKHSTLGCLIISIGFEAVFGYTRYTPGVMEMCCVSLMRSGFTEIG